MKKVLVLSLALILLLGIMSHGTSSYFSDRETSAGNTFTAWIGCTCYGFNVSDFTGNDRRIFYYDVSGNSASFIDFFDLDTDNGHPSGVASVGDYIYVLDQSDKRVYKYDCCGNILGVSRKLLPSAGGSLANPVGLAIDIAANEMWVVAATDKKIYLYYLDDAFLDSTDPLPVEREITLDPANTGTIGLAIDSTYLYVLDSADKRFYRYNRITGVCGVGDVSKVLKESLASGGDELYRPAGAMFYGTFLWVVDDSQAQQKDKVYKYDITSTNLFPDDGTFANALWQFDLDDNNKGSSGL